MNTTPKPIAFALLLVLATPAGAQFGDLLDRVERRAEETVERRAEQKAEETTNRAIDKAVEGKSAPPRR